MATLKNTLILLMISHSHTQLAHTNTQNSPHLSVILDALIEGVCRHLDDGATTRKSRRVAPGFDASGNHLARIFSTALAARSETAALV